MLLFLGSHKGLTNVSHAFNLRMTSEGFTSFCGISVQIRKDNSEQTLQTTKMNGFEKA